MANHLQDNLLRWDLSPADIKSKVEVLIKSSKKVYDAVGSLKDDELTYDKTLQVSS